MNFPRVVLAGVLFAALIIRLAYGLTVSSESFLQYDGKDYACISKNLWIKHEYAVDDYRWFESKPPDASGYHLDFYRPPLLPVVGALLYLLPSDWFFWSRMTQLVFGVLIVYSGYLLGRHLCGELTGLATATVIALYPPAIYYSAYWSTETLFGLLVLFSMFFTSRALVHKKWRYYAIAGAVLGLMCLARPNGVALAVGLISWLFLFLPRAQRIKAIGIAIAGIAITLSPWFIRNASHGVHTPLTSFGSYNMWLGMNTTMHTMYNNRHNDNYLSLMTRLYDVDSANRVKALEDSGVYGVSESNRFWLRETAHFVRYNYDKAATIIMRRLIHFWTPFPSKVTTPRILYYVSVISTLALYLLGTVGVLSITGALCDPHTANDRAKGMGAKTVLLVLFPLLFAMLSAIMFVFHLRFRYPIMELPISILAGAGLAHLVTRLQLLKHYVPAREI